MRAMRYCVLFVVRFSLGLCFILQGLMYSQCRSGLHAGITAQILPLGNATEEPRVQFVFLLLNDSNTALDVDAGSWAIVVNGTELTDSNMIFGNGPMPVDGYSTLKPGEHYEFSKELSMKTYFRVAGKDKIAWRGSGFESSTLTLAIPHATSIAGK